MKDNLNQFLEVKNVTENTADLYFYGDIVSSWWGAWDDTDQYPETVKKFLDNAKGKNLNIYVNSGGGSVFAGITIYNMIKNYRGSKTVYIDGLAGSIASVIALAGDRVVMRTGSTFMIHKPLLSLCGGYNADDMNKMANDLDAIQRCIMQVYQENLRPGVSIDEVEKMVNEETWLSSDEATKYFKIEVEESYEAIACVSDYLDKFSNNHEKLKNSKQEHLISKAQARLNLLKLKGGIIYE
ncbi:MAG: hypothetical protein DBY24_06010 [Prevotellaceae bacterium]|nr:MAG: hypothetical protein DBY24_06010 [Prevotellaceae bacterium]